MHARPRRISASQRRLEALAWAGGFFDGEGSTFARGETARPGYRQLNVVVPQKGGSSPPEVLVRFMDAMNGIGNIGRPDEGMYRWRVADYTRARAAVVLLRPWIGAVKRRQAAQAVATADEQYASGLVRGRLGRRRAAVAVRPVTTRGLSREARTRLDRAWAAGFLDGEGCFGIARAAPRRGGPHWYRLRASATQRGDSEEPAEVLLKLRRITGLGRIEVHGEPNTFKWVAEGLPAVERVLEMVGPWLGPVKRTQAREAMAAFARQVRLKGDAVRCKRGHPYDHLYRRKNGSIHRRCNACGRLLGRRKRAALGIPPRPFGDLNRRYTE